MCNNGLPENLSEMTNSSMAGGKFSSTASALLDSSHATYYKSVKNDNIRQHDVDYAGN